MPILSANHAHSESFLRWLSTKCWRMPTLHTVLAFTLRVITTLLVGYDRVVKVLLQKFTLDLFKHEAQFRLRLTDLRVWLDIWMIILIFINYKEVSCNLWIKTIQKNQVWRTALQKWVSIVKFDTLWFLTFSFGFVHKVQWFFFLLNLFSLWLKFEGKSLSWISFTQSGITTDFLNF